MARATSSHRRRFRHESELSLPSVRSKDLFSQTPDGFAVPDKFGFNQQLLTQRLVSVSAGQTCSQPTAFFQVLNARLADRNSQCEFGIVGLESIVRICGVKLNQTGSRSPMRIGEQMMLSARIARRLSLDLNLSSEFTSRATTAARDSSATLET